MRSLRMADFKSSCRRRTRSLVNSTRSMVERWRYSAICAPSTSCHSTTLWHEIDLRIAEGSCIDDISEQHDEHEPDGLRTLKRRLARSSGTNLLNKKPELRGTTKRWGNTSRGYGRLRKVKIPSKALMRTWASSSLSRTTLLGSGSNMMDQLWAMHQVTDRMNGSQGFPDENTKS